jgi:DNA-binding CsgD family transcriptional regulator
VVLSRAHAVAAERIARLCYEGHTSQDLRMAVLAELGKVVPIGGAFFPTADPTTLLYTSAVRQDMPADVTHRYLENEFNVDDVNKFRLLARSSPSAVTLDGATKGDWSASARYREIMAPAGFGDELRAAFRTGATTWGFLCLHQEIGAPGFTAADLELVSGVSADIAEGLRQAAGVTVATSGAAADGPGVVTIGADLTVVGATAAGDRWLADLAATESPGSGPLPLAVSHVVSALAALGAGSTVAPRLSVRGASGRWLTLHASHLSGSIGDGTVAVVIEPATPLALQPLIVAAYGLSPREAQVCVLALRGLATKTIAAELHISGHTVNDHLKAIFTKTGVSTRGELMSSVFQQHYLPPPSAS